MFVCVNHIDIVTINDPARGQEVKATSPLLAHQAYVRHRCHGHVATEGTGGQAGRSGKKLMRPDTEDMDEDTVTDRMLQMWIGWW